MGTMKRQAFGFGDDKSVIPEFGLPFLPLIMTGRRSQEVGMGIVFYQETDGERRTVRYVAKWIVDLAVVFVLELFLVQYLGMQYQVSGHSMEPVLEDGDVVLINRIAYRLSAPKRLDLAVFRSRDGSRLYLKRIIGLPGETVQIQDGKIYINGEAMSLPGQLSEVSLAGIADEPVELGEGEYFLLGDNRSSSEDSRFENIGNVSLSQIVGKAWFRVSPMDRLGFLRIKEE